MRGSGNREPPEDREALRLSGGEAGTTLLRRSHGHFHSGCGRENPGRLPEPGDPKSGRNGFRGGIFHEAEGK